MANARNVTILEEFPSPSLKEITEGAPVFLAMDKQGVRWSFSRFPDTGSGSFIPVRIAPYLCHTKLAFDESLGYCEADIADKIDMSTVQPLFLRE